MGWNKTTIRFKALAAAGFVSCPLLVVVCTLYRLPRCDEMSDFLVQTSISPRLVGRKKVNMQCQWYLDETTHKLVSELIVVTISGFWLNQGCVDTSRRVRSRASVGYENYVQIWLGFNFLLEYLNRSSRKYYLQSRFVGQWVSR
jgi:hypothetical protein